MLDNFDIAKGWHEISVAEFLEMRETELANHPNQYTKKLALISIAAGMEEDDFDELYTDELDELFNKTKWIHSQPSNDFKQNINQYYFKPLSLLTFGEYIDIEYYITDDYYKNLTLIAAILYRQQRNGSWNELLWEPYDVVNIFDRSKEFNNLPITDIFGIIDTIIKWRRNFINIYNEIFQPEIEDPDDDDELTEEDLAEEEYEQRLSKFHWQILLDGIANGDITKKNDILNLPLIQVFNDLAMKKVKRK